MNFEVLMLFCFGVSWPISITKALRTHVVAGKSPVFMMIVMLGYLSGIVNKLFLSYNWVIVLYIVNLLMVGVDLLLYFKFSRKNESL